MPEQARRQTIRLAGFTFDPLTERLDLPEGLRVEGTPQGPAPIIVQFNKSLTARSRFTSKAHTA